MEQKALQSGNGALGCHSPGGGGDGGLKKGLFTGKFHGWVSFLFSGERNIGRMRSIVYLFFRSRSGRAKNCGLWRQAVENTGEIGRTRGVEKSTGCPRFSTLAGRLVFFHSRCGEYFVGIVENLGENVERETAVLRRYLVELMLVIIAFTVSA
jgi:hypothetical protein